MRTVFLVIAFVFGIAIFCARPAEASSSTAAPNAPSFAKPAFVGAPVQPTPTPIPKPTPIPLGNQTQVQYAQFQDGCAGTGLDASACLVSLEDGKLVIVGGFSAPGAGYVMPKRYGLFKTSRSAGSAVQAATLGWGGDTLIASGTLAPTKVLTAFGYYTLPGFQKMVPVAVHDCLTVRWFADEVAPEAAQSAPTPPQCRTWSGLPTTTTTYTIDDTDWKVGELTTPSQTGARWQTPTCNPAATLYGSSNSSGTYYTPPAVYKLKTIVGTTYTPVPACPGGTAYVRYSMGYHFSNVRTGEGVLHMRVTAADAMPCAGKLFVTINIGAPKRYVIDGSKKLDEIVDTSDGLWPGYFNGGSEGVMVEVLPPDGTKMCPSAAVDPKLEVTTLNEITTVPGQ